MKKEIIAYLQAAGPLTMDQLADELGATSSKAFIKVVKQISQMEEKGQVLLTDQGEIALPQSKTKKELRLQGIFRAHKNGFGFVTVSEEEDDLFVGRKDVQSAIEGDRVEVVVTKVADRLKGTAAEAKVVQILEHSLKTAVGLLIKDEDKPEYAGYIQSKNQKIRQPIYVKQTALTLTGTEIVKVDIESYPSRKADYFVANLRDVVGHKDDAGMDVLEILESMDIHSEFPEAVLAEAQAISETPSPEEMAQRLDLREEITFTIDGADAKDLDDAVHIKQLPNGHVELGVHIADVSYYVTEGSALDREALERGTSVYVTDRVVPMLPERLSNGICSLNPNVDRLTQSAIMEMDSTGKVLRYWIGQSVIKTTYRMTYHDVNEMIAGDTAKREKYKEILPSLEAMVALHERLEEMRRQRGALNFDTSEAKIVVNAAGLPVDIVLRQRGVAERMIESFMLAANETVAEHFAKKERPFIYRIHEEPKAEKLQKFIDYARTFGLPVYGTASSMQQQALQDVMSRAAKEPYAEVLNMILLRSMQQARYSESNHGHYGLGAAYYTHFTSPIRRYPDLLVHRMIREESQWTEEKQEHFERLMPDIAKQTSSLERRAVDAEREVEAMKKAEFMQEFVGEEFQGIISSVVKFGLFVELPNTVEGLIHVTSLPEYYHFNERTLTLKGEKSGRMFQVGQPIQIQLVRVDKATGEIDFAYVPSDLDVIERPSKKDKAASSQRRSRTSKGKAVDTGQPAKKKKKAFYKEVAKKGGSHGKGARKRRRAK